MASKVATHYHLFTIISGENRNQSIALLQVISNEQLKLICEIFQNIRKGVISLNEEDLKLMKRHKDVIRILSTQQVGRKKKKALIKEKKILIWKLLKTLKKYLIH